MCTYTTRRLELSGSGKAQAGWIPITSASVYFDHPVHAPQEHTLNIDFQNLGLGPAARVAVELDRRSAAELAAAIEGLLAAGAGDGSTGEPEGAPQGAEPPDQAPL